jgi:pimeloyl-ACP methyl ester carboxylesterase/DNA-binding CsgD family transcriptional regulator/PAS domain-containing protein
MNAIEISNLIGLIYETASDESLWPQLLQRIAKNLDVPPDPTYFTAAHAPVSTADGGDSSADPALVLLACLAPHFAKAQDMNRQLRDAERELQSSQEFLDRLPIAVAMVDREGGIVSINRSMLAVAGGNGLLRIESGRLASAPAQYFRTAIDRVFSDGVEEYSMRIDDPLRGKAISLLFIHAKEAAHATVLAASQSSQALSENALSGFFGLTAAEARVTQQLALGLTVEEAAQELGVKLSTVRTHVQRVFGKVGVSRQPDLLRAIFSSPLWLDTDAPSNELPLGSPRGPIFYESAGSWLQVGSARRVAYLEMGDPNGLPVFMMHKLAGSRHLRPTDESTLEREAIRLIIPERPGNGDSEPSDARSFRSWTGDVEALAGHLKIERFAVIGHSAGTPYALATAHALPERVLALSIVAGMPPFRTLEDIRDYASEFHAALIVGKYAPLLLPSLLRIVRNAVTKNPYRYIERTLREAAAADKMVFADPTFRARYAASLLAGVGWGDLGMAREVLLLSKDWGFDLAEVKTPAVFWHGEMDGLVAVAGARRLVSELPNAELNLISQAGHYVMYSHWDSIFRDIKHRAVL